MNNENDTRELYLIVETHDRVIERPLINTTARYILIAYNDIMRDYAIPYNAPHYISMTALQPLTPAVMAA